MVEKPKSPWERIKQFALWQWGLLLIFGGIISNALTMSTRSPGAPLTADQQAEALGRATAAILFIVAGVVLIIVHFVRRKPRP
jgi:lipoprotein signal peptidase